MESRLAVGTCPDCGSEVRRSDVLIEYPRVDGDARYAECPGCGAVVHPA